MSPPSSDAAFTPGATAPAADVTAAPTAPLAASGASSTPSAPSPPGRLARLLGVRAARRGDVDAESLHALAALLLLVQLPHLSHLPVWTGAFGAALVGLRLLDLHRPGNRLREHLLSPLALTLLAVLAGIAVRAHYGYFVGRDPGVAFLFVLVSAKFAEVRRTSDTTLLLCLAAFLLLTQYFYSQTILAALVTLPAVLALGNALAVLRDPAAARARNGARDGARDGARGGATAGRLRLVGKLLVQGLPLAALLFVVFPRLPGPLWSLPEDSMATTGLSDSMEPGSIGSLSQSDAVAFRVEFDAVADGAADGAAGGGDLPPPELRYWRGPVLDDFDGRRWTASRTRHQARLPTLDAAARAARVDYTVMLEPHRQRWLFALDAPVSLPRASSDAGGRARALARLTDDGQLLADEPVSQLIRYRQSSVPSAVLHSERKPDPATLALAGRNPRSVALATRLRAAADDERAFATAVLARFRTEPYRYTLTPQLLGDAPVDEFLFDTRAGFCEHYAAAFVVLMRAAGVPARVVTGYLGGEMNGDYMIVRQSSAHAWAEAWIDGAWRRYDPTGAVAPSRVESGLAAALPDSGHVPRMARAGSDWLKAARLRWDAVNHAWQRFVVDFDDDSQSELWQRLGLPEPALWQLMVVVLGASGLWCLAVLGLPGRRRGRPALAPEERAWRRFAELLERRGVTRAAAESPAEYVHRAAAALPLERARVRSIGDTLVALRFARRDGSTYDARLAEIRRELRGLRLALAWRARLRPRREGRA